MGYYIKITGRGYLKHIDTQCNIAWYSKFSKQLTLSYCGDTESDAQEYKDSIVKRLKVTADEANKARIVGEKIVDFSDMFNCNRDVRDFIAKKLSSDNRYFNDLNYKFNKDKWASVWPASLDNFTANEWSGLGRIQDDYKSLENALKLVKKGKIVEEENNVVTITKKKKAKVKWTVSAESGNAKNSKKHCSCCGAAIPGAKYININWSINICPYCMVKFAETSEANVKALGKDIQKAYMSALFIENL